MPVHGLLPSVLRSDNLFSCVKLVPEKLEYAQIDV